MKLVLVGMALLLALPAAGATSLCVAGACLDAWSAKTGSCAGAGSERNVVDVTLQNAQAGGAWVSAETFCVTAGQQSYRSWDAQLGHGDAHAGIFWGNTGGQCSFLASTEGSPVGARQQGLFCSAVTPPPTPALLP